VKDYVRIARTWSREVFVPLAHPPGHAQVEFGKCIGGVRMKLHVFCCDLPQSDACFIKPYPAETTEAFLDGHERLLRLQRQLAGYKLLIIDELGYVPLSHTGAELLFEVFSQRYERGSTLVTSNLPFDEWTSVFGSERLTGALLDRLERGSYR
jgi:hypothetical protein